MSVQPKHVDLPPRYEEPEFTTEQRHRFTIVANAAQKRRDFSQGAQEKGVMEKLRHRAFRSSTPSQMNQVSRIRQPIWLLVILLLGLSAMYAFS